MMAYLTRPKFQDGGPVVPPEKPYSDVEFKRVVNSLLTGLYGTGPDYKVYRRSRENKVKRGRNLALQTEITRRIRQSRKTRFVFKTRRN